LEVLQGESGRAAVPIRVELTAGPLFPRPVWRKQLVRRCCQPRAGPPGRENNSPTTRADTRDRSPEAALSCFSRLAPGTLDSKALDLNPLPPPPDDDPSSSNNILAWRVDPYGVSGICEEARFDHVLDQSVSNADLYGQLNFANTVKAVTDGFSETIFAYGQTGSGKSFTIIGEDGLPGVLPRCVRELFAAELRDSSGNEEVGNEDGEGSGNGGNGGTANSIRGREDPSGREDGNNSARSSTGFRGGFRRSESQDGRSRRRSSIGGGSGNRERSGNRNTKFASANASASGSNRPSDSGKSTKLGAMLAASLREVQLTAVEVKDGSIKDLLSGDDPGWRGGMKSK
jgi:hypothetical protein